MTLNLTSSPNFCPLSLTDQQRCARKKKATTMPSSSTGKTHLERELIRSFRRVYTHLYISGAGAYLDPCTDGFANALDMTPTAIQRDLVLCPGMMARSKGMALSARLSEAEDACLEMGSLLTANHRAIEGAFWCRWAMYF
jgi:hypothetical protein